MLVEINGKFSTAALAVLLSHRMRGYLVRNPKNIKGVRKFLRLGYISVQPGSLYRKFLKVSGTSDSEERDLKSRC